MPRQTLTDTLKLFEAQYRGYQAFLDAAIRNHPTVTKPIDAIFRELFMRPATGHTVSEVQSD